MKGLRAAWRWLGRGLAALGALAGAIWVAYLMPLSPRPGAPPTAGTLPAFSHVFVIVMENQGLDILQQPEAAFLRSLAERYGVETAYYGVTHPSLPNYIALLTGRTYGSHSDNPTQRFGGASLVQALDRRHISWQAFMEDLPYPGYQGLWYPAGGPAVGANGEPADALYAKKHDPFLLLTGLSARERARVVPLAVLGQELKSGQVPRFSWITPNLCNDMHGQPNAPGAQCPARDRARLIADGDRFLATWIPRIMASPAWSGNAAIFVVWDERDYPGGVPWPSTLRRYLASGPEAPPLVAALPWLGRLGGGQVPLIVIARQGPHPLQVNQWADHYTLLKTWEVAWHLDLLGHTRSPRVGTLAAFFGAGQAGRN